MPSFGWRASFGIAPTSSSTSPPPIRASISRRSSTARADTEARVLTHLLALRRELDEDDVAELLLREVRDADGRRLPIHLHPLMLLRIEEPLRYHALPSVRSLEQA